jgi:hypothetical protein
LQGASEMMGTLLNLTHDELKEVYLSLTKGEWRDQKANKSATEKVQKYLIDVAMTCEFQTKEQTK